MTTARLLQTSSNHNRGTDPQMKGEWRLEFEREDAQRADPLTGWAGSRDTRSQVKLSFPTREAAEAYAAREGITLKVVATPPNRLKLQAYADNFK